MTYVSNNFSSSLNSNRKLKYFSVEVITFDGESYCEEIEARSADEAQEIAASMFYNVDYTMVQGWLRRFLNHLPQRVGCPPGQPFPMLICRHCLRSHLSIGSPLPLYAGLGRHRPRGSGQSGVPLSIHRSLAAHHSASSPNMIAAFQFIASGGFVLSIVGKCEDELSANSTLAIVDAPTLGDAHSSRCR